MADELMNNQNQVDGVSADLQPKVSPISIVAKTVSDNRKEISKRTDEQVISDLFKSSNSFYGKAMAKRSSATSAEELKAAQLDAFAAMVKGRGLEEGYKEWEQYETTEDIIGHYIDLNNSELVNKKLVSYAYGNNGIYKDPYDFGIEMGIIQTPEQQRWSGYERDLNMLFGENIPNWITKTYGWTQEFLQKIGMPINLLGVGQWNDVTSTESAWNDEAKIVGAIENYAWKNFNKHINDLNEYEVYKALNDLNNVETLKSYAPNSTKAITRELEGIGGTVAELMFPVATTSFSLVDEVPVVGDIVSGILNKYTTAVGQMLSPLTFPVYYNLPKDERMEWYSFLGTMFLIWNHKNGGTKWDNSIKTKFNNWLKSKFGGGGGGGGSGGGGGGTKLGELAVKENGQMSLYDAYKERKNAKNEYKLKQKETQNTKKLDEKAEKIVNTKTIPENKQTTAALRQLDPENLKKVKTYEDLFKLNEERSKTIEAQENALTESIDKRWGPEEDVWDVELKSQDGIYEGEAPANHPIEDFIKKMELMTEKASPTAKKAVNIIRQKYENGDISARDLANFKRILSKQFKLYKNGAEGKELLVSKTDIETTRQGLNYLLRKEYQGIPEFQELGIDNVFEHLDSKRSPVLALRENLIDLVNKVNKLKGQIPEDARLKEIGEKAGKVTSFQGWLSMAADWLKGKGSKMTDALDFQKNLNASLKKFSELMKELPDETGKEIDQALGEYLTRKGQGPKEVDGGFVEGEVMDPSRFFEDYFDFEGEANRNAYLEDYVKVVEPEPVEGMGYNENFNGEPTTTIRVTPEGGAGHYGQIIETYSKTLKEMGFSQQQINKVIDTLEKNNFKIHKVEPLFTDAELGIVEKPDATEKTTKKSNKKSEK